VKGGRLPREHWLVVHVNVRRMLSAPLLPLLREVPPRAVELPDVYGARVLLFLLYLVDRHAERLLGKLFSDEDLRRDKFEEELRGLNFDSRLLKCVERISIYTRLRCVVLSQIWLIPSLLPPDSGRFGARTVKD
jgi:hypothetical protein